MENQNMENNDILLGVILLEKILPQLKRNTREPIRRNTLISIQRSIDLCLGKIYPYCSEVMIMTPLMEVRELIATITEQQSFTETDIETKNEICQRIVQALSSLYLFAGKFYMTNEFSFSLGMSDVLRRIVDNCMTNNFYFGYDKILEEEGAI